MYKYIIFDLDGVLVNWAPRDYLMERFCNAEVEKRVYDLTFGSPEWTELDAGRISRYAASKSMLENAQKAGCAFEVQEVIDDWTSMLHTQHKVAKIASKLRQRGFELYYLSNIPEDILARLKHRSFWRLFSGGVASCEVHLLKPQPEIYQLLLSRYNLDSQECIFIDDRDDNVKAAYRLGITSIPMRGNVNALIHNLSICGIKLH